MKVMKGVDREVHVLLLKAGLCCSFAKANQLLSTLAPQAAKGRELPFAQQQM